MSFLKQIFALLGVFVASMRERMGASLVVTVGVACAVSVLISMLSIGAGIDMMFMKNVRADRMIVRGDAGATAAELMQADTATIQSMPGIRRTADGDPLVSADLLVSVQARRRSDNAKVALTIMGVGEHYQAVYPELRLVQGRAFHPGLHEVIVGKTAQRAFRNLQLGDFIDNQGQRWTIVGVFEAGGGLAESRLLTDAGTLRAAFKRDGFDYMTVMLESPRSKQPLSAALAAVAELRVDMRTEEEIRKLQSKQLSGLVYFLGYFVGSIMAVGATMGALNSMYMLVDVRRRELATLRALGFGSAAVAAAVLLEALLLATPGALLGVLLPWLIFNNNDVSFVGLDFALAVTPHLAVLGVLWAATIGLIGGLVPGIRAARIPVAAGLRAI